METILSTDLAVSTDTFKPLRGEEDMSIAEYITFMRDALYQLPQTESTQSASGEGSADGLRDILVKLNSVVMRDEIMEAAKNYRQAVRIKPEDPELHYELGVTSLLLKDRHTAREEYRILKDLDVRLANELLHHWNVRTPWSSR